MHCLGGGGTVLPVPNHSFHILRCGAVAWKGLQIPSTANVGVAMLTVIKKAETDVHGC